MLVILYNLYTLPPHMVILKMVTLRAFIAAEW